MPGEWRWYAAEVDDHENFEFETESREATLAEARLAWPAGTEIVVLEARMSSDKEYEGADFVPFVAVRNRERRAL